MTQETRPRTRVREVLLDFGALLFLAAAIGILVAVAIGITYFAYESSSTDLPALLSRAVAG